MKKMFKVISIIITILVFLFFIDLFVFRGFFSSKIFISHNLNHTNEIEHNCKLEILKKSDSLYIFSFANNSFKPKYFLTYRNEALYQKIDDTLFFKHYRKNIYPSYDANYGLRFGCGTGLNWTSINPFETFQITKSYKQLVKELSYFNILDSYYLFDYSFLSAKNLDRDSLLNYTRENTAMTDSIVIEYYFPITTVLPNEQKYVPSNKINLSLKDLVETHIRNDSIWKYERDKKQY